MSRSTPIPELLGISNHKNILIQGLPSSIEHQFNEVTFFKNLTPLLRARKIDFALVFAVSKIQLKRIFDDILPALKEETILWVAYPKLTSKITSDLNEGFNFWAEILPNYKKERIISLDHVWTAQELTRDNSLSLSIELELPEGISDEEAKRIITQLALLADEEHRHLGGHGLMISDIKVEQEVFELEGML